MDKTIWKFELAVTDQQSVTMPKGCWILDAQIQNGTLCAWAMVDPTAPREIVTFRVFGAGHPVSANHGQYVATVQQGQFVWHVFAEKPDGN